MRPVRVQLSRAKGWRMPPNTIKVDRSTRWGNPFNSTQSYICHDGGLLAPLHAPASLGLALDLYSAYLLAHTLRDPEFLAPLRGKNLGCWCARPKPGEQDLCHAAVLLRLANPSEDKP
jgi:hypothetical protein